MRTTGEERPVGSLFLMESRKQKSFENNFIIIFPGRTHILLESRELSIVSPQRIATIDITLHPHSRLIAMLWCN